MRRPSGAITAHCSGAHQRTRMAMSLCSGPQHGAPRLARAARHKTKKAPPKPPAPPPSTLSATRGCPRCSPCPFLLRMVPATHTTYSNHRSEAVLEHSHRSGAHEHEHDQGGCGAVLVTARRPAHTAEASRRLRERFVPRLPAACCCVCCCCVCCCDFCGCRVAFCCCLRRALFCLSKLRHVEGFPHAFQAALGSAPLSNMRKAFSMPLVLCLPMT